MSDPQDHSQSGFEPGGQSEPGPGDEAQRFWGEYARRPRSGGHREGRESAGEAGNGHGSAAGVHSHECLDWCPICRTADVLRATTSPELREQFQGLQRDAVETLRTLLESYIERLDDAKRPEASRVEDIPIE
jgi:hypothetical protein